MPIDTLKASKQLKDLGFDEGQAEGLAELLSDLDVASATKEDLNEVEDRLNQRIELSEERLAQRIERVEKRLLQWMLGGFASVAGLVTLLNYVVG